MKYIKLFETTAGYQSYVADTANFITPNVSLCEDALTTVYYHPANGNVTPGGGGSEEPQVNVLQGAKILCKYNVSNPDSTVNLCQQSSGSGSGSGEAGPMFSSMEVDGVEQEVVTSYTFNTTGEHTVLFTLSEGVTSISGNAFDGCSELTSVTIGNSVTSIGSYAFHECSGLTNVTIGNSVTSIGREAFSGCSGLTSITIGNLITEIGNSAFYGCSGLTNITIPDSVTSISNSAFSGCTGLTSVTIGNSVTSIGESAFYGCFGLTSITIPDSVTLIGDNAFIYCSGLTNITCNATTAPTISSFTFFEVKINGTLTVPAGSTGYDVWMGTDNYYLGKYNWTKVEA